MIQTDILTKYYGGVIAFTKTTVVANGQGEGKTYNVGDECHITPAILYMVGGGIIPEKNFKIVLRQVHQLEESELIELAEIMAPRDMFVKDHLRTVTKQGEGLFFTWEVHLGTKANVTYSLVVNGSYNVAITSEAHLVAGLPSEISQLAAVNQINGFRWMLDKHLDVYGLIPKRLAASRKRWTAKGYETLNHKRFKNKF